MTILCATKTSHVAVIAFPFTSHPISLYSLAVRLARSSPNTLFTFLNTPTSNASLFNNANNKTQLPPNLKPYDLDDGVPAGQNASELNFRQSTELFYHAMVRPRRSIKRQLDDATVAAGGAKITCLLVDAVLSIFLADVAGELGGVPWIAVWVPSPQLLSAYVHTDTIRGRCATAAAADGDAAAADLALDFVPGLEGVRVSDHLPVQIFHGEFGDQFRFLHVMSQLGQVLPRASAVVLNSFRELNPDDLNRDMEFKFQSLLNVGFYTISVPLPPPPQPDSDPTGCLAWLDGQKARSVAYISFGTSVELSEDEIKATAEALQETEISFLWSLRDVQKRHLPNGFVERTQHHGKIVAWMDQIQALGHGSVGVHVSHCGYNSMNESIVNGVPIIGRPFWGDHHIDARMVEIVWGIGVKLEVLTKNELIKALKMVLEQEEGKKMRERALALKKHVFEASSPTGSGIRDFNALMGLLSAV